jgi:hypothetical protein
VSEPELNPDPFAIQQLSLLDDSKPDGVKLDGVKSDGDELEDAKPEDVRLESSSSIAGQGFSSLAVCEPMVSPNLLGCFLASMSGVMSMMFLVLVVMLFSFRGDGRQSNNDDDRGDDQHEVQPIDDGGDGREDDGKGDEKAVPSVDLKECVLVTIVDDRSVQGNVGIAQTLADDEFWDYASQKLKDVENLDDDDENAKRFLEANKLKAPVVFLLNGKSQVVWIMPLPEGGTVSIRERLDNGG